MSIFALLYDANHTQLRTKLDNDRIARTEILRIARTEISTDFTLAILRIVNFLPGYVFNFLKSFFNVSVHEF